jgi:ketosteroid isomerase-like protein
MRSRWSVPGASICLLLSVFLDGVQAGRGAMPQRALEQELKDIDQKWLHAATIQDIAFLRNLFSDGMFEVQRGGVVETGEEMRRVIGSPGRHIQIDIDDVEVRGIYGDTAIITDRTVQNGTAPDGRKVRGEYTVMRVLQKQSGKWRALGAQMTPRKPSTIATPVTHETPSTVPANEPERELIDTDHKWVDAATNGDTSYLKGLFTARMFEVRGDGRVSHVDELLKGISSRKPGRLEGYSDQVQIRGIYGDTAVLTERLVLKGKVANGQAVDGQWRATHVLVRQKGKWQAAASALTPIDQK